MIARLGFLTLALTLFLAVSAFAHTPLCDCFDNADGTITCEGGFSDGSSAAGVEMTVVAGDGTELIKGRMTEDSEFTFDKPAGDYRVVFNAGEGHLVEINGKDIVE